MSLYDVLEEVKDEESFLRFVAALRDDRKQDAKNENISHDDQRENEWENSTIEEFFDAALSWAEDSKFGRNQGLSDANIWRKVAVFLYCGKIYE